MIEKIKKLMAPDYMLRPVIHRSYYKLLVLLLIALVWHRFLDANALGLGHVFSILGILMLILVWFNYLKLDGVRIGHLFMDRAGSKKGRKHHSKDMIDFVDEKVISYNELDSDERTVVGLLSDLVSGVVYLIAGIIFTFFI